MKYRSLVWIVEVPGLSIAEKASRTVPRPNSSRVPGSSSERSSVPTRSLAAESRSSQPSDDAGAYVLMWFVPGLRTAPL